MNKDWVSFDEIVFYDQLAGLCIPQGASVFPTEETGNYPCNNALLSDNIMQHNILHF